VLKNPNDIPLEDVEALYKFLQGEVPECLQIDYPPKLSEQEAFSIIYYLQEVLFLLPDRYERCDKCGDLYDSNQEGATISEDSEPHIVEDDDGNEIEKAWDESEYGFYCDCCRPD